ncbi:hypothetical protein [Oceaniglobus trochenteri]|uniref:hypothetical protein n=1 Tax=Oceaniglobus trochenteri TaxID=2763260 RepID=UPI001CFF941C|nr:hypothetical protein [Oceaniglobus trochenteri]
MKGPVEVAQIAWGDVPDWVMALAEACAATSQNRVAGRLGRSGALVSTVLRNKYSGDLSAVEVRVRGVLMSSTIECPALGLIPENECQDWRAKSRRFSAVNALRRDMFRACKGCPRNRKEER